MRRLSYGDGTLVCVGASAEVSIGSASSSSIGAPVVTRSSLRLSSLAFFLGSGLALGIALDVGLARAGDSESALGHIVGDHRTGSSVRVVADGDGCDE